MNMIVVILPLLSWQPIQDGVFKMAEIEKPDSERKLVFRTTDADFDIELIELVSSRNRYLSRLDEKDAKPLNRALTEVNKKHGVKYAGGNIGIWGLANAGSDEKYPHLIDTLIEHFQLPYRTMNKIGIALSLGCAEARNTDAPVVLMRELKKLHSPQFSRETALRERIVFSLITNGDDRLVEDTQRLIDDDRYADLQKELKELLAKIQKRKWKPKKNS